MQKKAHHSVPFPKKGEAMIHRLRRVTMIACAAFLGLAPGICAKGMAPLIYQVPSQSALKDCQAAAKANPRDPVAHTSLGNWYLHAGQLNAAIREYKKSIELNANFATAWNNLGSAYHAKKKFRDAAKCYRKASEIQPDMAIAYRNLGSALLAMSLTGESIAAFRRALELDPTILNSAPDVTIATPGTSSITQYYYFAKLSAATGRVDAAIEFLKKAQGAGFVNFKKVLLDSDFKDVITDARFESMAHGVGN